MRSSSRTRLAVLPVLVSVRLRLQFLALLLVVISLGGRVI